MDKNIFLQIFEEMGYRSHIDDEGDIVLHYQMKDIFVLISKDEPYVVLKLANIAAIKEGDEHIALVTSNKMTRELKIVKVYVEPTLEYVSANCEFFYSDEQSLKKNLEISIRILGLMTTLYVQTKLDLKAE